jgi:hypothetical protein
MTTGTGTGASPWLQHRNDKRHPGRPEPVPAVPVGDPQGESVVHPVVGAVGWPPVRATQGERVEAPRRRHLLRAAATDDGVTAAALLRRVRRHDRRRAVHAHDGRRRAAVRHDADPHPAGRHDHERGTRLPRCDGERLDAQLHPGEFVTLDLDIRAFDEVINQAAATYAPSATITPFTFQHLTLTAPDVTICPDSVTLTGNNNLVHDPKSCATDAGRAYPKPGGRRP